MVIKIQETEFRVMTSIHGTSYTLFFIPRVPHISLLPDALLYNLKIAIRFGYYLKSDNGFIR